MKRVLMILTALVLMFVTLGCEMPVESGDGADTSNNGQHTEGEVTEMYIYINGNKLQMSLAGTAASDALVELLRDCDITYTASDYGDFEKVGSLGHSLPTKNSHITTQPGDVILYQGDQIVLFYGSNSWSYTRIGRIEGYTPEELRTLLGAGSGNTSVRLSLIG